MDYGRYGFLRVAAVAPVVEVGDPAANAAAILAAYEAEGRDGAALVVTPELGISPHGTAKRRLYAGQRRFSRRGSGGARALAAAGVHGSAAPPASAGFRRAWQTGTTP